MTKTWIPFILVLAVLCATPGSCQADHLDHMHSATGNPEKMLSGVYINSSEHGVINEDGVYIEPMADVIKTLGTPDKVVKKNKCEKSYIWVAAGVRTEVGSGCVFQKVAGKDVMRVHGAYAVEVWGTSASGKFGVTGKGLALGDSWAEVQKLYGTRCNCGRYTSGTGSQSTHGLVYASYGIYQWNDEIEFDVDSDKHGHVVHMLLLGDTE